MVKRKINCYHDSFAYCLKEYIAKKYKLNLNKLLTDSAYKELHRDKLIKDSNELREANPFIWFDQLVDKYKDKDIDVVFIISSDFPRQGKDTAALAIKEYCEEMNDTINPVADSLNVLVVADLRYHNEIDGFKIRMKKHFKRVVHIHITTTLDTLFMRVKTHEALYKMLKLRFDRSERELTVNTCDPDYLISNNKGMEVYYNIIQAIFTEEITQFFLTKPTKKLKK